MSNTETQSDQIYKIAFVVVCVLKHGCFPAYWLLQFYTFGGNGGNVIPAPMPHAVVSPATLCLRTECMVEPQCAAKKIGVGSTLG